MLSKDTSQIERETKTRHAALTDAEKEALGGPNLRGTLSLSRALTPGARENLKFGIRSMRRQLRCPVLALNGGKDCRVPPKEYLGGIEKELKAAGNRDYTLQEWPDRNHLVQTCGTGATSAYVKIEKTVSPLVLQTISDWIIAKAHFRPGTCALTGLNLLIYLRR